MEAELELLADLRGAKFGQAADLIEALRLELRGRDIVIMELRMRLDAIHYQRRQENFVDEFE